MFSITDQLTKIVSTTPVSEKHGKDRVSALSIGLYVVMPSTALDHFDPALRPSIWRKTSPVTKRLQHPISAVAAL